jgi:hypothetical protein
VVPAGAGAITYEGRNLLTIPAHQRMHLGIAHVLFCPSGSVGTSG